MRFPKGSLLQASVGPCVGTESEVCACGNGLKAPASPQGTFVQTKNRQLNHCTAIYWQLATTDLHRYDGSVVVPGVVGCPLTLPFCCLFSRVLYGNKITDLPRGVFGGLYTLQLL